MVTKVKIGRAISFFEDETVLRKRVNGVGGEQVFYRSVKLRGY